jgi:hypothetical protein
LLKTNVNERFSQQEVIIIIKLFLSIIFNGFPVLSFPVCIVHIFRPPEKRWVEVPLYIYIYILLGIVDFSLISEFTQSHP